MSIQTKEYLKTRFETGDKPSAQDFIDLLDSLVGKSEPVESNAWQPPNSPVYMSTGQEITCTHPTVINELYNISISQEIPGVAGNTNISINFDEAAENSYTQENVMYTDFLNGAVVLHNAGDKTFPSNILVRARGDKGVYFTSASQTAQNILTLVNVSFNPAIKKFDAIPYYFDGTSYARFADTNLPGSYTVEAFIYFVDVSSGASLLENTSGEYKIRLSPTTIHTAHYGIGRDTYTLSSPIPIGQWVHVRVIKSGSNLYLYTNGVANGVYHSTSGTSGMPTNNFGGYGDYSTILPVRTYIAEYTLYNIPLSISEFTPPELTFGNYYPVSKPYYVTTTDNSHFSMLQANKIESLIIASVLNTGNSIKCLASFDGRATWNKYNGVTWEEVSLNSIDINGGSIASLQAGFSNMMTDGKEFIDLAFSLYTTDKETTPSLDQVTIVYTDKSHYEIATAGSYTSAADFGVKRVDPNTTLIKRLNNNPGKVFITMNIG